MSNRQIVAWTNAVPWSALSCRAAAPLSCRHHGSTLTSPTGQERCPTPPTDGLREPSGAYFRVGVEPRGNIADPTSYPLRTTSSKMLAALAGSRA
jgi:hypothetical protein